MPAFSAAIGNTRRTESWGADLDRLGRQGKRRRQPLAWSGVASVCLHIEFDSVPESAGITVPVHKTIVSHGSTTNRRPAALARRPILRLAGRTFSWRPST